MRQYFASRLDNLEAGASDAPGVQKHDDVIAAARAHGRPGVCAQAIQTCTLGRGCLKGLRVVDAYLGDEHDGL